jgi:hypothetical protein
MSRRERIFVTPAFKLDVADGACVHVRGVIVIMGSKTRREVRPLT